MRLAQLLVAGVSLALAVGAGPAQSFNRAEPKKAASGETQVVAKAGGREITLSELRIEMARQRLAPSDPQAERIALQGLVERTLLANAARAQSLHRKPEAMSRMQAASEQALADFYLGLAAQPPEPTQADIDDFIAKNPSLFSDRRVYEFAILTMPTGKFDDKLLSPLFDEASDFKPLAEALRARAIAFSTTSAIQPSTAFPKQVREQLARYSVSDNIVIKGEAETQVMKIMAARREALPASEWKPMARQMLIEEKAAERVAGLLKRLRSEAPIAYYRPSAAPAAATARN